MLNNYDQLSDSYCETHYKPDKQHSMRPTVEMILSILDGKKAIDVGCGDGYFTGLLESNWEQVIGIDNSIQQIEKARLYGGNIEYQEADMFNYEYRDLSLILAPFVLNYCDCLNRLKDLLQMFYDGLDEGGHLVSIIDSPRCLEHDMFQYGSIKFLSSFEPGSKITIDLYDKGVLLTTLYSFYYSRDCIEEVLSCVGFNDVKWVSPIVSQVGVNKFGQGYWDNYINNCDVSYLVAKK